MTKKNGPDLFGEFLKTVQTLRSPEGCPWDLAQTHQSLVPYSIEETYELVEAIQTGNDSELMEELGDVLLQVVLHSVIAEQRGAFGIADVLTGINEKMIYRHPHVFAKKTGGKDLSPDQAIDRFLHKKEEKKYGAEPPNSFGLPTVLPALQKSQKIGEKTKRVNFDWLTIKEVFDQVTEEFKELQAELTANAAQPERIEEELGDFMFTLAQLSRHLNLDAEQTLQKANRKFERRYFKMLEIGHLNAESFKALPPPEKEELWRRAKQALKS